MMSMQEMPSSRDVKVAAKAQRKTAFAASAILVAWLLYLSVWPQLAPASYWLRVDRIEVKDAIANNPPGMLVERHIRRPFRGSWIVSVMRESESGGGFYTYCRALGQNDYRPENVLPYALDLDWWTWPDRCPLEAGKYYLNTLWTIEVPGYPPKEVRITSNVFTMSPE